MHRDKIDLWEEYMTEDADTVVFAYGAVAKAARGSVKRARERGLKWGMFRPISIWPFLDAPLAAVADRVDRVVVAEMNLGQLDGEVRRVVAGRAKVDSYLRAGGHTIHPDEIYDFIVENDRC